MKIWIHIVLGIIWLVTCIVFSTMTIDAYQSMKTELPRYIFRIPSNYNVAIGNVRFQDVINDIADTHEKSINILEQNIRDSSKTGFWLNLISAIAALAGFVAQVGQFVHERSHK